MLIYTLITNADTDFDAMQIEEGIKEEGLSQDKGNENGGDTTDESDGTDTTDGTGTSDGTSTTGRTGIIDGTDTKDTTDEDEDPDYIFWRDSYDVFKGTEEEVGKWIEYSAANGGTCLGQSLAWLADIIKGEGDPGKVICSASEAHEFQLEMEENSTPYGEIADLNQVEYYVTREAVTALKKAFNSGGSYIFVFEMEDAGAHAWALNSNLDEEFSFVYEILLNGELRANSADAFVALCEDAGFVGNKGFLHVHRLVDFEDTTTDEDTDDDTDDDTESDDDTNDDRQ